MVTLATSPTLSLGFPFPPNPHSQPNPHPFLFTPRQRQPTADSPLAHTKLLFLGGGGHKSKDYVDKGKGMGFGITIGQQTETPQTHGRFEEPGGEVARDRSSLDNEHTALKCSTDNDTQH